MNTTTNPAPVVNPVEALLTFIQANASDEVFEKAQDLESLLSLRVQGAESEVAEMHEKRTALLEELADGNSLAGYALELKGENVGDLLYHLLDNKAFKTGIEEELKGRLFQDGTLYLSIPETRDHMDVLLAPALAQRIATLGIEEALRLLNA